MRKIPIATAFSNKYKMVRMPNLSLASNDVADVLAYLEAQSGGAPREPARKKDSALVR